MENLLAKWFERKYLEYQMQHGLMTLKDFAELLEISRPYLSLILSGDRTEIGQQTAVRVAETLGDYSILNILGYDRPAESKLPPGLKSDLDKAVTEISRKYDELGITDFSSPDAVQIAKDILSSFGITYNAKFG